MTIYLLIAFIGIPMVASVIGSKITKVFHYEITESGWMIKWGFANQVFHVLIWLWLGLGLLGAIYFSEDGESHRQVIIIIGVIVSAVFLLYLREKKVKSIYASFEKQSGILTHGDAKMKLEDIERFEYKIVSSKSDSEDSIYLHACLKNGCKIQFNTSPGSLISSAFMYHEIVKKLSELTNIPYTEK